jgi:hypothetical protein
MKKIILLLAVSVIAYSEQAQACGCRKSSHKISQNTRMSRRTNGTYFGMSRNRCVLPNSNMNTNLNSDRSLNNTNSNLNNSNGNLNNNNGTLDKDMDLNNNRSLNNNP